MTSNHLLLYRIAEIMFEHQRHFLPVDLLFDDEQIGNFVKSIQIDSPYQQMLFDGVLTESVREEKLFVSFTVEGYFHYVLGEVIYNQTIGKGPECLKQIVEENKLNAIKPGLEQFFIKCAINENESVIIDLIDLLPNNLDLIVKAFVLLIVNIEKKKVLDSLFEKVTDNDLLLLIEVLNYINNYIPQILIEFENELLQYKFLSEKDIFKKSYIEALRNVSTENIDLKFIDKISSSDFDIEFEINIVKINLYFKLNKFRLAEKTIKRNLFILKKIKSNNRRNIVKMFFNNISTYYSEIGNYNLAIDASKKALTFSDKNQTDFGILTNNLALRYIEIDKYDEAENYLNTALSFDLNKFGNYSENVASRYGNFGLFNIKKGNYLEAINYLILALKIDKSLFGNEDDIIATRLINLSEAYRNTNQIEEALNCIYEARKIDIINYGAMHPMISYSYNIEAHIYSQLGDFDKAIQTINKAIEINNLFQNGINDKLNRDYNFLGAIYFKSGNLNKALSCFHEADKIESSLFCDSPELRIVTWLNICKIYLKIEDRHNLEIYLNMINALPEDIRKEYSSYIKDLNIL
jgi:tetratricopeptide (TPR) repeat protein